MRGVSREMSTSPTLQSNQRRAAGKLAFWLLAGEELQSNIYGTSRTDGTLQRVSPKASVPLVPPENDRYAPDFEECRCRLIMQLVLYSVSARIGKQLALLLSE